MKKKPIYDFFKRAFDLFCSLLTIILLSLPLLIVAIAIKCDSKGPVFFKQNRVRCGYAPVKAQFYYF